MQSKAIIRIAAVVLATGILGACDQASRDVGADIAACDLEEFKASYPSKTQNLKDVQNLEKDIEKIDVTLLPDGNKQAAYKAFRDVIEEALKQDRKRYIRLCMRSRGWQLGKTGLPATSSVCFLKDFDQANCYEPASPAGDGIVN